METPVLNAHNKDEYPPAHTAEHILNATLVKQSTLRPVALLKGGLKGPSGHFPISVE